MNTPTLDGVRAKLARADTHIRDLETILGPITERANKSVVRDPNTEPADALYHVADIPELEPEIATIIGDAVYNMRSALDHFAWQLVILDGQEPLVKETYFPIYDTPTNSKGNPRNVTIQPNIRRQDILDALVGIQPYRAVEDYGHDLWETTLWNLGELCNLDKHRLLFVVVHRLDLNPGKLPWWESGNVVGFEITSHPLKTNDVVARFRFITPNPDFDPHLSLAITLDEGPARTWPNARSVVEFLRALRHSLAADLNGRFLVPLFPNEPMFTFGPTQAT
jgi:hypothetical protein